MTETIGEAVAAMRKVEVDSPSPEMKAGLEAWIHDWAGRLEAAMRTAPERVGADVGDTTVDTEGSVVAQVLAAELQWIAALRHELGLGEEA